MLTPTGLNYGLVSTGAAAALSQPETLWRPTDSAEESLPAKLDARCLVKESTASQFAAIGASANLQSEL